MTRRLSTYRTSARRTLLVLSALLVAGVAVPLPAAHAAVGCSEDGTFCINHAVTASQPGTATPQTTAAAPFDVSLAVSNTTPDARGNQTLWLKTLSAQLLSTATDGPAFTPSAQLPDNLLVAGSATGCAPGGDYAFTACTAGHGHAWVNVTGTSVIDGIKDATFGIQRIVNVNPTTVPGAVTQLLVVIDLCVDAFGQCSVTTSTTAAFSIGAAAGGARAPLSMDVTSQTTFSYYSATATADTSLDTIALALSGTSATLGNGTAADKTYQVLRLPRTCGTADGTGSATSRGTKTATVPLSFSITGCPTATSLTSTQTAPFNTSLTAAATTATSGRTIAAYRWAFGDGVTRRTTTATTSHTYASSAPRTITVVAEDSAGALSAPRTLSLKGSALTTSVVAATTTYGSTATVSGVLTDVMTHAALGGRGISVRRCKPDHSACTALGSVTTSSSGAWSLKVTPTAAASYAASWTGGAGYLGRTTFAAAAVRTAITFVASRTSAPVGGSVTLSGTVSPSHAGQLVQVQRYVGGVWTTVANRTLTSTSTFSYTFVASPRGPLYFQAIKAADADHAAATSHPLIVTAT